MGSSNPALHVSFNNHYRDVTDYDPVDDSVMNRSAFSNLNYATYSKIVEPAHVFETASDQKSRFALPHRDSESQLM